MCDICSDYGVQTTSVRKNSKEIEVCFKCLEVAGDR